MKRRHRVASARGLQEAAGFSLDRCCIREIAAIGRLGESVVGHGVDQEVRQPAGHLVRGERERSGRRRASDLDAIEKARRLEHAFDDHAERGLKSPLLVRGVEERAVARHLFAREGAPESSLAEGGHELVTAVGFLRGRRRAARQNLGRGLDRCGCDRVGVAREVLDQLRGRRLRGGVVGEAFGGDLGRERQHIGAERHRGEEIVKRLAVLRARQVGERRGTGHGRSRATQLGRRTGDLGSGRAAAGSATGRAFGAVRFSRGADLSRAAAEHGRGNQVHRAEFGGSHRGLDRFS